MRAFLTLALIAATQVIHAAPMGKLPIMASRGNCFAITPVGMGGHNESISYYVNDSHDLWVRSWQKSIGGAVRSIDSAWGYEWTWRAYAGFVDGKTYTTWTVDGHHAIRFSLTDIRTSTTRATTCNLGQGWPWS